MRIIMIFVLLLVIIPPARAGESPWYEIAPDAHLRLISADQRTPENTILLALQLRMPAAMKTYWRVPGETGIPLQVDFTNSRGVQANKIIWPYPLREQKDGYLDHVYYGDLTIPIEIEVDRPGPFIDLTLTLGVCSDICVPVQVKIQHQVSTLQRDSAHALRIAQALALAPIAWDAAEPAFSSILFEPEVNMLHVKVESDAIDKNSVIVSVADGAMLFGSPQIDQSSQVLRFEQLSAGRGGALIGETVTLTFLTVNGAYEVSAIVENIDGSGGQ